MAAQFWEKEASTAAIAVVVVVGVGVGVRSRSSWYITRWNMADSASKQTLLIILTASTGYFPILTIGQKVYTHYLHIYAQLTTLTFSRLPRQHYTVSTIKYSISYITRLSSGGTRLLNHTIQHLMVEKTCVKKLNRIKIWKQLKDHTYFMSMAVWLLY